jgi:high-affinity iron transporter
MAKIQIALIISTCFLYLVGAGLLSKGVGFLEDNAFNKLVGGDASESGNGPGSYDIRNSVWHINCCSPTLNGGWGVFNSLFGWTNSATYGTVISYNLYWIVVSTGFLVMGWKEKKGRRFGTPRAVPSPESDSITSDPKESAQVINEEISPA